MFFDLSPRKIYSLLLIALLMGAWVGVSIISIERNTDTIRSAGYFLARARSESEYFVRFKMPATIFGALAGAGFALGGGSTYAAVAPVETGNAKSVPVLLYHGEGPATTMPIGTFIEQLRALKADGWQTVTLEDFEAFMKGTKTLPEKSFLLTFDDARRDTFYSSDPVLKDLGYTAVMFVITGFSLPDNGNAPVNGFYLSKSELAYMAESGRWELESHGDQDHRGYAVPASVASGTLVDDRHFLSNKFWLPGENRAETDAEYAARVRGDLALSKTLLEQDFGKPVIGYAYPFNDFGQESINYTGARAALDRIVPSLFTFAFYQTWAGNGDLFNYPNPNEYLIKRIEPAPEWSGADLIAVLNGGRAKALPFAVGQSFGKDWQTNWGEIDTGSELGLFATASTTGATAFLDGTETWDNYQMSARVAVKNGTFSLIARHTETNAPYVVCAFAGDRVYLEQHVGESQVTLASERYHPPSEPADWNVAMDVTGATASCSAYGVRISAALDGVPRTGGAGVAVWDPTAGTASASVEAFSVKAL